MKTSPLKVPAVGLTNLLAELEETIRVKDVYDCSVMERLESVGKTVPPTVLTQIVEAVKVLLTPKSHKPHIGYFIVLAGLDRSGKETQCFNPGELRGVKSIYKYLTESAFKVLPINLPSYKTMLGSLVGAYLGRAELGYPIKIMGSLSENYAWILWTLDRAQHNPTVGKWLEARARNVVLAKRWTESNLVYQKAQGIEEARVLRLERNIVQPRYTIIIDIPVEEAHRRTVGSGSPADKYERLAFLKRVRENYINLQRSQAFGEVYMVNGLQSPRRVNEAILRKLQCLGL